MYYSAFPACTIVNAALKTKAFTAKATDSGAKTKTIKIWPGRALRPRPDSGSHHWFIYNLKRWQIRLNNAMSLIMAVWFVRPHHRSDEVWFNLILLQPSADTTAHLATDNWSSYIQSGSQTINRFFTKLFRTSSIEIAKHCQRIFRFPNLKCISSKAC